MPNRYTSYWGPRAGIGSAGSVPDWPYVGRGRGGLPRCMSPIAYDNWFSRRSRRTAFPGTGSYSTQISSDQELNLLKEEQQFIKTRLEQIDARIAEMEKRNKAD